MQEPTFWILTSLASGTQHGYSILASVEELSSGSVKLKVPTLYAALERLTKDSLIVIDHEEVVDGRFRRYFVLTPAGRVALKEEIVRKSEAVKRASAQLGMNPIGLNGS